MPSDAPTFFGTGASGFQVTLFAGLIIAVFIPLDVILFVLWPRPSTVSGFFTLLQSNVLLGLVSLDLLYVIDQILVIPIILALYITLRRINKSIMTIATVLGLVGIIAIFASNTAVNMLYLSNQYSLATTDAQRFLFLAAGEAMLAIYSGTSYHVHIILGSVALVIISIVMLQDTTFSKTTAYTGILANIFTLGLYVPVIGILILLSSLAFFEVWVILLARRFLQLGRGTT